MPAYYPAHLTQWACVLLVVMFIRPVLADDPPFDCADFWNDGSPVGDPESYPCYEYPVPAGADRLRVFYPPDWLDDSLLPDINGIIDAILASRDSYEEFAPMKPVYLVFSAEEEDEERPGRSRPVSASVGSRWSWPQGEEPCPLTVFPFGIEGWNPDETQQVIAHEVFHCFQRDQFDEQQAGPPADVVAWWLEGSATYFINAPYPTGDLEHEIQAAYDPDVSLLVQSYPTTGFFQSLATSGAGRSGILQLLDSLPTGGSTSDQQIALAAFSDMQRHFHEFGKRYLDAAIPDDGGGVIPLEPPEAPLTVINETGNYRFTTAPFTLGQHRLRFAAGGRYTVQLREITGQGRESMRRLDDRGNWSEVPEELVVDCSNDEDHLLLSTSAEEPGANREIILVVAREDNEDCCDTGVNLDPNLVGSWRGNPGNIIEQVYPFEQGPRNIQGGITISINENGHFTQTYEPVTVTMVVDFDNGPVITFTDSTSGTVSGCLMTEPIGAMGRLSIILSNRVANISRRHTAPGGQPLHSNDEHIGLAFGIPGASDALGLINPDGPDAFYNKKVRYERIGGTPP